MADPIRVLVQQLARLPGVGEKSATRLAYHLLRTPDLASRLALAIADVTQKIGTCATCMTLSDTDPCAFCSDGARDGSMVCVVSTPADIAAIERGAHFRGRYHVLHGLLSPLDGIGPDELRIGELLRRVGREHIAEVILATNPSVEGEATAMYIAKLLGPLGIVVTRIATGMAVGSELEYTDQATIARAIAHRAPV